MPSRQQADATPALSGPAETPAVTTASPAALLAQANRALWLATLSLMTAFMQTPAPAHRLLLARRIGRNFETLARQECFDAGSRARFGRLARRWQARALQFAPAPAPAPAPRKGLWRLLF